MDRRQFDTATKLPVRPSLSNDERVRIFQRKLYLKAKQERGFKAYSLYDKICQYHVLAEAYDRVRTGKDKQSAAGVDGVTFEKLEKGGRNKFLLDLQGELQRKGYRSQAC